MILHRMGLARTPTSAAKHQRDQRHDQQRRNDQPWRKWYKTARWQRLRTAQLRTHPLCKRCLEAKPPRFTPATVVHHVHQHQGNERKFWSGPFASSCKPCHDSAEQGIEARGYDTGTGLDGLPTDPAHPFNR